MTNTQKFARDPDFFVVGLQKSGTYWVTALLDAHPDIRCLPAMYGGQTGVQEGRFFDMLASINEDGGETFRESFLNQHNGFYADLVPLLGSVPQTDLYKAFRERYRERFGLYAEGKRLVGDKTTEYIFHLEMIDDFFPGVKKLCIIRDPKDRVVSWHFDQLRKGRRKEETISDEWLRAYIEERVKQEYERMLAYNGVLRCFTYERLSEETEEVVSDMLAYLGADNSLNTVKKMISAASLEALRERDARTNEGKGKKRGEEVPASHYRKGIAGDWQNYLTKTQVALVEGEIGDLQKKVFEKYTI